MVRFHIDSLDSKFNADRMLFCALMLSYAYFDSIMHSYFQALDSCFRSDNQKKYERKSIGAEAEVFQW